MSSGNSDLGRKLESVTSQQDELVKQNQEVKLQHQQTVDELRCTVKSLDAQQVEINSRFERECIIYKSKIQHLEDFKQKLSSDLMDSNDKFELAMNHLNLRHATEREKWEKSHESLIKSIEHRHTDQNDQLRTEYDKLLKDLREREE